MDKDLIIGGASNYTFDQMKYWINSIKQSGFDGDIVLAVTNIKNDELIKVAEQNVNILAYGRKDEDGNYVSNSNMVPHVERFFHIWNYLKSNDEYRYVIQTDVRDVVFQSNPSKYLENNLTMNDLIAAGEGLKYKDEPWGNNNLLQAFGAYFHNEICNNEIYNVGVIAGKHRAVQDVLLMIMQLSINRPIPIVDQAVYNFILSLKTIASNTRFMPNDSEWAVNLGTTLAAIKSGAGDIGQNNDPTAIMMYNMKYLATQPKIVDDVIVNQHDTPYCIVHQYDRVAGLAEKIMQKYG